MLNFKKADTFIVSTFILLEVVIYILFLLLDRDVVSLEIDSSYFKYAGIILCLIFSLFGFYKNKKVINILIPLALVFTLISDYFLLFNTDSSLFTYGLYTFICAQLIYFVFIVCKRRSIKEFILNLILRITLSIVALVSANSLGFNDLLTNLALLYFVELVSNFIYSFWLIKDNKLMFIFTIGLLLFIACDINVALNNVQIFEGIDYHIVNYLMRVFYLPSQVMLSLTNMFVKNSNLVLI